MEITRQAEQYSSFDQRLPGTPPEPRTAAPESRAVRDLLKGPAIPQGLNNTRQASRRTAVDTSGMDPSSHAYNSGDEIPWGEFGAEGYDYEGVTRGEFDRRMRDWQQSRESGEFDEMEDEDDLSGYNWGPEPTHGPGGYPKEALAQSPVPVATFGQVPTLPGHGFVRGHRIGLPYGDGVIKGTVTHLDGENVGVRWDDGQNSSESPWDIHPL